jgi:hypothetical protein
MKKKRKISEKELADVIIEYYEDKGYETYKEVTAKGSKSGGTNRADIVAVKGEEQIVIETKITFGLKLIQQAFTWKVKSHKTYICIPRKKRTSTIRFGYDICRDMGIGIIEIDVDKENINFYSESSINEDPYLPKLYEIQKDSDAGTSGKYVTPFKITKNKILDFIKQNGETSLTKLVEGVDHHYKSDHSAKQSISKLIRIGVIELQLFKKNNKIYIK